MADAGQDGWQQALAALDAGEWTEALEAARAAVAAAPDEHWTYCALGEVMLVGGRWTDALEASDKALALAESVWGLSLRIGALLHLERPQEALAACDRALALAAHEAVLHEQRARALLTLDRLDEAAAAIDESLERAPERPRALGVAAEVARRRGRLPAAEEFLRRAIAAAPRSAGLHEALGDVLSARGKEKEARASLETAYQLDPTRVSTKQRIDGMMRHQGIMAVIGLALIGLGLSIPNPYAHRATQRPPSHVEPNPLLEFAVLAVLVLGVVWFLLRLRKHVARTALDDPKQLQTWLGIRREMSAGRLPRSPVEAAVRDLFGRMGDRLSGGRATRRAIEEASAILMPLVAKWRAGEELTRLQVETASLALEKVWAAMRRQEGTRDLQKFSDANRLEYWLLVLVLDLIGVPEQDGWHLFSELRTGLHGPIRDRLRESDTAWTRFCAVPIALAAGDRALADECLARLSGEPRLRERATAWTEESLILAPERTRADVVRAFLAEHAPRAAWDVQGPQHPLRWIMVASIFPNMATDPRLSLRSFRSAGSERVALEQAWNVTNRTTALEQLEWLLEKGHSAMAKAELDQPPADTARSRLVGAERARFERFHIRAWDLGRGIALARSCARCGFLTEVEAEEWLRRFGDVIRATYSSWDEYADDYSLGDRFFDPQEDGRGSHGILVEWLRTDPRSPWKSVRFGGAGEEPPKVAGAAHER